jgi:hypothetical protein
MFLDHRRVKPDSRIPPGKVRSRYASVKPSHGQIARSAGGCRAATVYWLMARTTGSNLCSSEPLLRAANKNPDLHLTYIPRSAGKPREDFTTITDIPTLLTGAEYAFGRLLTCQSDLKLARVATLVAADNLAGARKARADELADKLADAIAFAERLAFCVEGDLRADQGGAMRRLGFACIGALLGALLAFVSLFLAAFFIDVSAMSPILSWLFMVVAIMIGFVIGLCRRPRGNRTGPPRV